MNILLYIKNQTFYFRCVCSLVQFLKGQICNPCAVYFKQELIENAGPGQKIESNINLKEARLANLSL